MKLLNSVLVVGVVAAIGGLGLKSLPSFNSDHAQTANQQGERVGAKSYILQGANSSRLNELVASVGGDVSREFPIINAISAMLTPNQANAIKEFDGIRIQDDRTVMTMNNGNGNGKANAPGQAKKAYINNYIAQQTGANILHNMGITGQGVTVAVIDSGTNMRGDIGNHLFNSSHKKNTFSTKYNAILGQQTYTYNDDQNGHGSHVAGIISSSAQDENGNYNGMAPEVYLLSVKAFDASGASSYSRVLDSLNWIYENRYKYKIRVINMSLGAEVDSHYWQDPINQAVMRLWDAGIVVVTSAGNNGKDMGITVPGNNPYALTVGAVTDNYTPYNPSDDRVTTFSSKGPTFEGFIKPEVVAYGARIANKMDERNFFKPSKQSDNGEHYSEISGTSQASAVVAGIAALIISNDPSISPDDVKCRITKTARAANNGQKLTYSPFQQGNGLVNAYAAVMSTASGCGNKGLNIVKDLTGVSHFSGPARQDAQGKFYIQLGDGSVMTEGNQWGEGAFNLEGNQWGEGAFNIEGNQWGEGAFNIEGKQWGLSVLEIQEADLSPEPVQ